MEKNMMKIWISIPKQIFSVRTQDIFGNVSPNDNTARLCLPTYANTIFVAVGRYAFSPAALVFPDVSNIPFCLINHDCYCDIPCMWIL